MVFTFLWGPCSRLGLTFWGLGAWPELILFSCPAWPVGVCGSASRQAWGVRGGLVGGVLWRGVRAWLW